VTRTYTFIVTVEIEEEPLTPFARSAVRVREAMEELASRTPSTAAERLAEHFRNKQ
jgi:hypothetical protein